jgi:hypothetical protein
VPARACRVSRVATGRRRHRAPGTTTRAHRRLRARHRRPNQRAPTARQVFRSPDVSCSWRLGGRLHRRSARGTGRGHRTFPQRHRETGRTVDLEGATRVAAGHKPEDVTDSLFGQDRRGSRQGSVAEALGATSRLELGAHACLPLLRGGEWRVARCHVAPASDGVVTMTPPRTLLTIAVLLPRAAALSFLSDGHDPQCRSTRTNLCSQLTSDRRLHCTDTPCWRTVPAHRARATTGRAQGKAYELPSRWRRSSASMNGSRSPSSTASTLPVS